MHISGIATATCLILSDYTPLLLRCACCLLVGLALYGWHPIRRHKFRKLPGESSLVACTQRHAGLTGQSINQSIYQSIIATWGGSTSQGLGCSPMHLHMQHTYACTCRSAATMAHRESGSDYQAWLPKGPAAVGTAVRTGVQGGPVPAERALHAVSCCCHVVARLSNV